MEHPPMGKWNEDLVKNKPKLLHLLTSIQINIFFFFFSIKHILEACTCSEHYILM